MTLCDHTPRGRCMRNPMATPRRPEHHAIIDVVVGKLSAIRCNYSCINYCARELGKAQQHKRQNAQCTERKIATANKQYCNINFSNQHHCAHRARNSRKELETDDEADAKQIHTVCLTILACVYASMRPSRRHVLVHLDTLLKIKLANKHIRATNDVNHPASQPGSAPKLSHIKINEHDTSITTSMSGSHGSLCTIKCGHVIPCKERKNSANIRSTEMPSRYPGTGELLSAVEAGKGPTCTRENEMKLKELKRTC